MPISFDVQAIAGTQHFDQIISFHSTAKSDIFYQESLVPFFLMLMRNSTAHPSQNRLTLFTPESQFALFNFDAVHGRGRNSQHQHNCFEFTVVLEGGMYQLVEGKRYYYPAGSCCLMNRNTLHTEELSSDFCCAFVSVTTEFVQQFLGDGRPMLFPEDSAMQRNMIFQFFNENQAETAADSKDFLDFVPKIDHEEQVRVVHQIFEDLLQTLIDPQAGATFRVCELFSRFIAILCNTQYYHSLHVTVQASMESLLFSRIDHILCQRHGRVTHAELSAILNYNGSYLGRIVKKYTGKSLFDYSMTFTMAYAAEQLAQSKKSAAQIASELHFSNRSHFYQIFRRYYGMTPKAYRCMYGCGKQDRP